MKLRFIQRLIEKNRGTALFRRGRGKLNPHLRRPLFIALYIGVASAFLPILKEVNSTWWFFIPLIWAIYQDYTAKNIFSGPIYKYLFTVILLAATFYTIFFNFSIYSLLDLLLLLETVKIVSPKRIRDVIQIVLISLFNLLMAAVFTIDLIFAVSLMVFFITSALIFAIINTSDEMGDKPVTWRELRPLSVIISATPVASLILAGVFFTMMPRTPFAFFTGNFADLRQNRGFSENANLGYVGDLLENNAVMFRAVTGNPISADRLYWRGITYAYYDGYVWSSRLTPRNTTARHFFFISRDLDLPSQEVIYYLEPTDSKVLYTLDHPIEFMVKPEFGLSIMISPDYSIYFSKRGTSRLIYRTRSQSMPIRAGGVDSTLYLQLPENLNPEIERIAQEISSKNRTDLERALAVEAYFRDNFSYSLKIPRPVEKQDPLTPFFQTKRGYCEYFATAMALVLRKMGIPSRTVAGFRGGEWNEYGKYYLVREKMAHMWVEAVIGDTVWMRFDPTPFVENGRSGRGFLSGLKRKIENYIDYIKIVWYGDVVNYTFEKQRSLFDPMYRMFLRRPSINIKAILLWLFGIALAVSIVRLLIALWKDLKTPRYMRIYRSVMRRYERSFRRKQPYETPMEFASSIGIPELQKFVEIYYRIRFNGESGLDELKRVSALLKTSGNQKRRRSNGSESDPG